MTRAFPLQRLPSFAITLASVGIAIVYGVEAPVFTFALFAVPFRYGLFLPIWGLLAAVFLSEDRSDARRAAMLSTLVLACAALLLWDIADQRVSVFLQQVNVAFRMYAYVLAALLSAWGLWLNSRFWLGAEAASKNRLLQALGAGYVLGLAFYGLYERSVFVVTVVPVSAIAAFSGQTIWNLGIRAARFVDSWTPRQKEMLVFACAFLIRFAWAANVVRTTGANFKLASDDGQNYLHFGRMLLQGGRDFWPYGGLSYSYFLGILDFLGGSNFYAMVFVQALISALVPWAVFRLGRLLISEKAAWAGALFAAVNGNLIFLGGVLGMEAISIPLIAVGIVFLVEASISNTMSQLKWGGYAGLALGLALMFRNDAILALPVVACAVAFRVLRIGISLRQALTELKTVSAGIIAGALVLSSLNFIVLGTFGISNRQIDISFAQELPDDTLNTARLARMGFNPFRNASRSLTTLTQEPVLVPMILARTLVSRIPHYFMRPSFGYFDLVYVVKPYPAHTLLYAEFVQTLATVLTILGLMYFVRASFFGDRQIEFRILVLFFGATTVFYSLIVAFNSRYRGGLEFIIALAAAAAFERMFLRRERSAPRLSGQVEVPDARLAG